MKYVDYDIVFQEIPDETTLAFNISNCPFRCVGCHSPHLRDNIGTELTEETLLEIRDKYPDITCIAFMGGTYEEVLELATEITFKYKRNWSLKIAWYTGEDIDVSSFDTTKIDYVMFDYVKTGPYIPEKGGLNCKDTNQRLYKIDWINDKIEDITYKFWK